MILFIGNSHLAALKEASDKLNQSHGFIYHDGEKLLNYLECGVNGFSAKKNNPRIKLQLDAIGDLRKYNVLVLYGLRLRSTGPGKDWIALLNQNRKDYSVAAFHSACINYVRRTAHYKLLKSIAKMKSHLRIISIPCPLPGFRKAVELNNDAVDTSNYFSKVMQIEIQSLGVEFIDIPKKILSSDGLFTNPTFKNSRPSDFNHVNSTAGELILVGILDHLKG